MVKIGEDEKVSFTVVWKGRTELQVNEIIPKLTDYARSLEEFEQNEFEHLVIVHSPPKDDYDQQADFVPDQMIDAMSSKETQDVDDEDEVVTEPIILHGASGTTDSDSITNESTASGTSSMQPQCGSELSDNLNKREREIDDIISKDHIELSVKDQAQLFEMFEDGESDESVPVSDEMKAYDDKLFRFAVYNKITAPNSSDDLGVGSDESSDIVDIPINSNANLDDEELIKISEKQIDDAMAAVEDGEFDISQDDLPSDETTDEVDPNADKIDRQQSLEFEYENVEHTLNGKDQHEINEATIPSGAPVWTGNVHATQFTPTSAPMVSTAPTKEEWGHPSDQETEPAEIVANVEIYPNSGDIRERGFEQTKTNDEIRNEMEKTKHYRNISRTPHGPSNTTDKGFHRDRTTNVNEDWEGNSSLITENRPRDYCSARGDYGNNRRFENNTNRRSEGYNNRDVNFRQPRYNNENSENWGNNGGGVRDRNDRRSFGNDNQPWQNQQQQQSRPGGYNTGSNRRASYNSDNGSNHGDGNPTRNFNTRPERSVYDSYGNRQRNNDYNRNNNDSRGGSARPPAVSNNNREVVQPPSQQVIRKFNRCFQSDHCNRDDFNGTTKQINDESFGGGMRSDIGGVPMRQSVPDRILPERTINMKMPPGAQYGSVAETNPQWTYAPNENF